jgi:hypothetical protein
MRSCTNTQWTATRASSRSRVSLRPVRSNLAIHLVFLFVELCSQVMTLDEIECAVGKLGVRTIKLVQVRAYFLMAVSVLVCLLSTSDHFVHASVDLVDRYFGSPSAITTSALSNDGRQFSYCLAKPLRRSSQFLPRKSPGRLDGSIFPSRIGMTTLRPSSISRTIATSSSLRTQRDFSECLDASRRKELDFLIPS